MYFSTADNGKATLQVSESAERIDNKHGAETAPLTGLEILKRIHTDVAISVVLSDCNFGIPPSLVAELKKRIQAQTQTPAQSAAQTRQDIPRDVAPPAGALARVAEPEKLAPDAEQGAPLSLIVPAAPVGTRKKNSQVKSMAEHAPLSSVEIVGLNSREVISPFLGLQMFVPASWKETRNDKSLYLQEQTTNTRFSATGLERANLPIMQWAEMRLAQVAKEQPYLSMVSGAAPISSDAWKKGVDGMVAEFSGIMPGDTAEQRLLVLCVRTHEMLIAITITAKTDVFDKNRGLYRWLINHLDFAAPLIAEEDEDYAASVVDIGRIASGHRLMLLGLAIQFPLYGLALVDGPLALPLLVLAFSALLLSLWRLRALDVSFPSWVPHFLYANPLGQLFLLFRANSVATRYLKDAGFNVGLFGAPGAVPKDNHDLRNVLFAAGAITTVVLTIQIVNLRKIESATFIAFSPAPHTFTVDAPGKPELDNLEDDGQIHSYTEHKYYLATGRWGYVTRYLDFQRPPVDPNTSLDQLRDSLVDGNKGTLIWDNRMTVDSRPARDVRMETPSGRIIEMRCFYIDKRLYMAIIDGPKKEANSTKFDRYLGSFHAN